MRYANIVCAYSQDQTVPEQDEPRPLERHDQGGQLGMQEFLEFHHDEDTQALRVPSSPN